MSKTVAQIMNPKLLYIKYGDRVSLARRHIIEFGVTAVPVLDETHRPVGVVSLRDLSSDEGERFEPSGVVATVKASEPVDEAAKRLADSEYHHLVVVDDDGVAVGMVSSLDFLRALVGLPLVIRTRSTASEDLSEVLPEVVSFAFPGPERVAALPGGGAC